MNMLKGCLSIFLAVLMVSVSYADTDLAQKLQDISVTIHSGSSQGSGVIITRDMKKNEDSEETVKVNFVWTAGHVVSGLRSTRSIIAPDGSTKKVIEFKPAYLIKELVQNGRRVGEIKMEVRVVKYSDADNGEDLALLMVRKMGFVDANAEFYLHDDMIVDIGTHLYHVGSLLGQTGANSMTSGIVSQVGRVIGLGQGDGVLFDQTTVTAFPGSSGGGVFMGDGDRKGEYVGMLVRGAGETFNLIVPIRRMHRWAESCNLLWALDSSLETPTLDELHTMPVESSHSGLNSTYNQDIEKSYPFLINHIEPQNLTENGKVSNTQE